MKKNEKRPLLFLSMLDKLAFRWALIGFAAVASYLVYRHYNYGVCAKTYDLILSLFLLVSLVAFLFVVVKAWSASNEKGASLVLINPESLVFKSAFILATVTFFFAILYMEVLVGL